MPPDKDDQASYAEIHLREPTCWHGHGSYTTTVCLYRNVSKLFFLLRKIHYSMGYKDN